MKYLFNYQDYYLQKLTKEDIFLLKNWNEIKKIILKNPNKRIGLYSLSNN